MSVYYGYLVCTDRDLSHHGILGQKWGIRRYQNADGTLTPAGRKRLATAEARSLKRDVKWSKRNEKRIMRKAYSATKKDMQKYEREELRPLAKAYKVGTKSKTYINAYNRRLADLMNTKVNNIETPSGRVIRFVAKRGQMGVYLAVADKGYDMGQIKNGVYSTGRIAYKKKSVDIG